MSGKNYFTRGLGKIKLPKANTQTHLESQMVDPLVF